MTLRKFMFDSRKDGQRLQQEKYPKHADKIYLFIQQRRGVTHIWHAETEKEGARFAKKGPYYVAMFAFLLGWTKSNEKSTKK